MLSTPPLSSPTVTDERKRGGLVQAAEGREARVCNTPRLLNKMFNNAMAIGVRVEPELERRQAGSTHWSEQVPDRTDWTA